MITLNLNQCDLEPIRFINSIQPFGALIALDNADIIKCYSKNIFTFLDLVPRTILEEKYHPERFQLEKYHLTEHLVKDHLKLIEIEKTSAAANYSLNLHIDRLRLSTNQNDLLNACAEALGTITGFDRVMIYQFHDDHHGEVVAEHVREGVESFLGLHYPASDIPQPARDIFLKNWIRIIPDVDYTPIELESSLPEIIDLGRALVRAVSPIHIQYLKNMKVKASLTISLIIDNKLWGLIACHHLSPKMITKPIRELCATIGRVMSSLIELNKSKEAQQHSVKIKAVHSSIRQRFEKIDDLAQELTTRRPTLIDLIPAQGASAALYRDGYWGNVGITPSNEELNRLVDWLTEEHAGEEIFYSDELSGHFAPALAYKSIASGLLAVAVPKTARNFILWFRPEVIQTVTWAGNPEKSVVEQSGQLTPRSSFEEWKSTYYGKSLPWKSWDIEAAIELRNLIMAADLKEQFIKEQKARHDAERAKKAREDLIAVVSHDLKNPLSAIKINLQVLKRHIGSGHQTPMNITDKILRTTSIIDNLISDILSVAKLDSGQMQVSKTFLPIGRVLQEAVEMLSPIANEKNIRLILENDLLDCQSEYDFERILQVLSNLVGNAIKFSPENGVITLSVTKHGPMCIKFAIKDEGPGIPIENIPFIFDRFWQANQASRVGIGLGLAIARGIVEAHGGEIWVESKVGIGSSFQFTLPVNKL
jgi:two-component system, chemotaxis family, sensor kinase Cph1